MNERTYPEDQRQHLRLCVESTVFIELVSPGIGSNQAGKVAICRTLDVSRGGLRVSLDQQLPVGAILQIGVELPNQRETLYLAAEVRWCEGDATDQHWYAGFRLLNANDSDIDHWIAQLSTMDT